MGQAEHQQTCQPHMSPGQAFWDLFDDGGRMAMHSVPIGMGLGAAHPWEPAFLFSLTELMNGIDKSNWEGFISLKFSKKCSLIPQRCLDWGYAEQLRVPALKIRW